MKLERAQAEEWAVWFQALGDPTRILILHLLATEQRVMTTWEIVAQLDVGQSTVSHHLAKLAECRFVLVERHGTTSHWTINRRCIECFPTAAQLVFGRIPTDFTRMLECQP